MDWQPLCCRKIKAEWNDAMAIKRVVRGTPQGGVLSPLLWLLAINRMLKMFDFKASKLIAYADDIAIIVTGKCLSTLSSIMNSTLQDISEWHEVPVWIATRRKRIRRYKFSRWYPPKIDSRLLTLKSHAKYLGMILDSKLLWKQNVEKRMKKATGISPRLMLWCYIAIARPILLYRAIV